MEVATPSPKKHKSSHRHSDKSSSKKHKSGKHHHHHHHHHSHHEGGKTVSPSTAKEPPPVVKKKPMISESDSEDDIPLAVQKSVVKDEFSHAGYSSGTNSVPTAPAPSVTPHSKEKVASAGSAKIKTEKVKTEVTQNSTTPSKGVKVKSEKGVKVKGEKRSAPNGSDVPMAKRKPAATPSMEVVHPSKMATPKNPTPPKPASATKRKKTSDSSDESEYSDPEQSESDDDDFKPSSSKKPKKTPTAPQRKKSASAAATPTPKAAKTPPSTRKTPAGGKAQAAKKTPVSSVKGKKKAEATDSPSKGGRKKKEEETEVWKWWEEKPHPQGIKWLTLEHKGPYFAPAYDPLPTHVQLLYDGKPMALSEKAEEAAGFFAKMLEHDYTKKDVFCNNFFQDWRKEMTHEEARVIKDFSKCDFTVIHQHYKELSEARKAMSKEEKLALKKANEEIVEEYGWCMIDGHKERIGNFKIEPPGLFRGRGDHPKQGKIKRRIEAEDVLINIGKEAAIPAPPVGHKWKEVQHDNKVTWLASWTENIQGSIKYVMLNPTSRLKAEKDLAKYETARRLHEHVDKIRKQYTEDWRDKEMKIRQRAVALYFIDKLALRAGNEKDTDESADTVGCCSIRVEHIKLHEEKDGKENVIEFDFLGKDSIRYYNCVPVERQVFKNVRLFMNNKTDGDDLFDRLTTASLNKHLAELMPKLTAKVFRTYNASKTLEDQLNELTVAGDTVASKILSYNRANRAVAVLCNHQRAAPKTFDQQMTNLQAKIDAKEDTITETKAEIKALKKEARATKDSKTTKKVEAKQKQLTRLEDQLHKLEVQATDKEENKEIALGTSKLNYLDPRITVAWCKKWDVPVEKIYNKTQRQKFAWAMDMADEDFVFTAMPMDDDDD